LQSKDKKNRAVTAAVRWREQQYLKWLGVGITFQRIYVDLLVGLLVTAWVGWLLAVTEGLFVVIKVGLLVGIAVGGVDAMKVGL